MQSTFMRFTICSVLWSLAATVAVAQDVNSLLVRIKAVGKEGVGNVEAAKAWKELVAKGPAVIPDVLTGMDDASPVAVNWLRGAVEAIQDKAIAKGQPIPKDKIEAFLKDTSHAGRSRRLAYECLVRLDPSTPAKLLPKMLDDPGAELRRDAVAARLDYAKTAKFDSQTARQKFYQDLLAKARDRDQIDAICKVLKTDHQVEIDLVKHLGFVTRWQLVGPFDNVKGVGFHNVYPPEKGVDVTTTYVGKGNDIVRWKEHSVDNKPVTDFNRLAQVDLTEAVGKLKGAVVFAYAAVASDTERPVELRASSNNAVRIFLNGKEVYFREEYHHGAEMDQHVGKGVLKTGRNEILVKVCQNEQTESWAQRWDFQLRVCDALGAAVPVLNVTEKK